MNTLLRCAAATSLLLATVPTLCLAQAAPGNPTPTPTPAAVAPAPTPMPGIPRQGNGISTSEQNSVDHVRSLVRDVETNSDNIKSKGDFGAQLFLVQGQEFFENWVKPATPSINPVAIAPRGENIYTVVIFYGIAHDTAGLSNVSYDITVHKPDGSIYSQSKNLIGWQGLAPQESRSLELGRDHIALNFSPTDPAGLYTVDVIVRDNVSRVELPLKQSIVVQ